MDINIVDMLNVDKYINVDKYQKLYVISFNKTLKAKTFINKLLPLNIINDKLEWTTTDTCIIFNVTNIHNTAEYYLLNDIINSLQINENVYNNKLIVFHHKIDKTLPIIKYRNNLIIHESIVKRLLTKYPMRSDNVTFDNLFLYLEKYIHNVFIKHNFNPITKIRDRTKTDYMFHLNKMFVLYDNKQDEKLYIINNKASFKEILQIINGNHFSWI